jgi:dolichol-phosphate mannosyltransferase
MNYSEIFDIEWAIPKHKELLFSQKSSSIVLVIPVINEGLAFQNQLKLIKKKINNIDIVIADGGSTDNSTEHDFLSKNSVTAMLVKDDCGNLSSQLRIAYSWCLKQGYKGIITMDGNNKDGVDGIDAIRIKLNQGYDYVQGSRYIKGSYSVNTPFDRVIGNRLIHAPLLSIFSRFYYTDTTNGFRGYSAKYLLNPRLQPFRDVFDDYQLLFYLTYQANLLGMKTCEVPVSRSYPKGKKIPTKIKGVNDKIKILFQLISVVSGRYNPKN